MVSEILKEAREIRLQVSVTLMDSLSDLREDVGTLWRDIWQHDAMQLVRGAVSSPCMVRSAFVHVSWLSFRVSHNKAFQGVAACNA